MDHERDELRERLKLETELEDTRRDLRVILDFLSVDHHLTDKGRALLPGLLREIEAIEQDTEAIRQEHGWS